MRYALALAGLLCCGYVHACDPGRFSLSLSVGRQPYHNHYQPGPYGYQPNGYGYAPYQYQRPPVVGEYITPNYYPQPQYGPPQPHYQPQQFYQPQYNGYSGGSYRPG